MFKNIAGIGTPTVIGIAGGEINMAKKEAQMLALLIRTPVRLQFNGNSFLIDAGGSCIEEKGEVEKLLDLVKAG